MPDPFHTLRFVAATEKPEDFTSLTSFAAKRTGVRGGSPPNKRFGSDEDAARFYLSRLFERDPRPAVRGLTAPQSPEVVPDLKLERTDDIKITNTKLLRFAQTCHDVPIFGSSAVVELGQKRDLVALQARLVEVGDVSPHPSIGQPQALEAIATLAGRQGAEIRPDRPATLVYYNDQERASWHLAYLFEDVPAAPASGVVDENTHGCGPGPSPRADHPELDYIVDAHDAKVLKYFRSSPAITRAQGLDVLGEVCKFYVEQTEGGYELVDTLKKVKTYDLCISDLGNLPNAPVRYDRTDFGDTHPAAVSAHCNAVRVYDFFNKEFNRSSVDGKGMEIISIVNCTYSAKERAPVWTNAVWWKNKMWYGQIRNQDGKLESLARHLDIIAHELTHGITQYSSDLVYDGQSGALNESFSDIFGVVIKNWNTPHSSEVTKWTWTIGEGFRSDRKPLRDMRNPKTTDDPDHMKEYVRTMDDNGGVHRYSNIHNKAAYNVFSATDAGGNIVFDPKDVAVLYFLCLIRLDRLATFATALQTLLDVAATYFQGSPKQNDFLRAIESAYDAVGITAR